MNYKDKYEDSLTVSLDDITCEEEEVDLELIFGKKASDFNPDLILKGIEKHKIKQRNLINDVLRVKLNETDIPLVYDKNKIWERLQILKEEYCIVLDARYGLHNFSCSYSYEAIGEYLGKTAERVRLVTLKALSKLRNKKKFIVFEEYWRILEPDKYRIFLLKTREKEERRLRHINQSYKRENI